MSDIHIIYIFGLIALLVIAVLIVLICNNSCLMTLMFAILGGFVAFLVGLALIGDSEWAYGVFFIHVPIGVIAGAIIGALLFRIFWRHR